MDENGFSRRSLNVSCDVKSCDVLHGRVRVRASRCPRKHFTAEVMGAGTVAVLYFFTSNQSDRTTTVFLPRMGKEVGAQGAFCYAVVVEVDLEGCRARLWRLWEWQCGSSPDPERSSSPHPRPRPSRAPFEEEGSVRGCDVQFGLHRVTSAPLPFPW